MSPLVLHMPSASKTSKKPPNRTKTQLFARNIGMAALMGVTTDNRDNT